MEHLCAVLANLYVWTSPLALATAFKNGLGNPVSCEDAWDRSCSEALVELGKCAQNASYMVMAPGGEDDQAKFFCTAEACPELVWLGTLYQGEKCPTVGFTSVGGRTVAGSFFLAAAFYGIFELGNAFAEPFGDDESDLGICMMAMGNGLEADLRFMMESDIPQSRLRRILSGLDDPKGGGGAEGHEGCTSRSPTRRRASAVKSVRSAISGVSVRSSVRSAISGVSVRSCARGGERDATTTSAAAAPVVATPVASLTRSRRPTREECGMELHRVLRNSYDARERMDC